TPSRKRSRPLKGGRERATIRRFHLSHSVFRICRMGTVSGDWAKVRFSLAASAAAFIATPSEAADGVTGERWTIVPPLLMIENDSFFRSTDRHYTSGLYASATSGAKDQCWCGSLADTVMLPQAGESAAYRYGFFAGQNMFTPENLSIAIPDPRDRPYGG